MAGSAAKTSVCVRHGEQDSPPLVLDEAAESETIGHMLTLAKLALAAAAGVAMLYAL
jgi:hypothetical protein